MLPAFSTGTMKTDTPREQTVPPRTRFRYRCPQCGKIVTRECGAGLPPQTRRSLCEATGRFVRMRLLPAMDEIKRTARALKRRGRWPEGEPI